MAKLSLMFEKRLVKEVPIGTRPVGIGRAPDNDLPVDNLAVSNHHARVFSRPDGWWSRTWTASTVLSSTTCAWSVRRCTTAIRSGSASTTSRWMPAGCACFGGLEAEASRAVD